MLFPTTLVGSYPQPEWLIDRAKLAGRFPPRVRARELWRIPEPLLAEAQDDATILAIKAQEAAGLDIITDGEIRRESYSNRFATALEGIIAPDCGMKYLPRDIAFDKLLAMVGGAKIVRAEVGGSSAPPVMRPAWLLRLEGN
jgi:methionine synthase II (cobalamin-independent)